MKLVSRTPRITAGKAWGAAIAVLGAGLLGMLGGTILYRRRRGLRRGNLGLKIDTAVAVEELPQPLYRFWRNFENLPRVMSHLASVTVLDDTRSHWVVKGPAGVRIEWDAEIFHERPGASIAWRTIGDSTVRHAGSVRFEETPDGQGTVVRLSLQYDPPGGEIGDALAALLGGDAGHRIEADLREFKRAVESRDLATSVP
ncbi:MAG: SRPBCC family protein [Candidatus Rokuibacteriota bacterium]